eukprot:scaffold37649_cov383-Skeletonema_dohrnii-CCMP3373.AAC.1
MVELSREVDQLFYDQLNSHHQSIVLVVDANQEARRVNMECKTVRPPKSNRRYDQKEREP